MWISRLCVALILGVACGVPAESRLEHVDPPVSDGVLNVTTDDAYVTISGDSPILRYHYANVPFKPYVQELFSPSGFNILLDAPSDHLHHHGLMFAVAAEGVDFWAELETCGKQVHKGFPVVRKEEQNGTSLGSFTEQVDWQRPTDSAILLNETRTVTAFKIPEVVATVLTWTSELTPAKELPSVSLTGSHYFGLGLRFQPILDGIGTFRNSAGDLGQIIRGEERNGRATWSCYSAVVDGKPLTVAMFDDPANARHPATWFTMPKFAYMSATLDLKTEPLVIKAGETLKLRYGVAVWDAQPDDKEIEAMYKKWLALPH